MLSLQLRSAATDADESKLQRLLQNVDPAVERDEENYTALHYAAWGGLAKVVDVYVNSKVRGPLSLSLSLMAFFNTAEGRGCERAQRQRRDAAASGRGIRPL